MYDLLDCYNMVSGLCISLFGFVGFTIIITMDREVVFKDLRVEFDSGYVTKRTAKDAQKIYNAESEDNIKDCFCSTVRRSILAKKMLEWFESTN